MSISRNFGYFLFSLHIIYSHRISQFSNFLYQTEKKNESGLFWGRWKKVEESLVSTMNLSGFSILKSPLGLPGLFKKKGTFFEFKRLQCILQQRLQCIISIRIINSSCLNINISDLNFLQVFKLFITKINDKWKT